LSWPQSAIWTSLLGLPEVDPKLSMFLITSKPSTTLPNTTFLPSSHAVLIVHMKNWLPLESGPAFIIDENACPGVFQNKVFVCKFTTVDRLTAGAVVSSKVTTLQHEAGYHTVELSPFVVQGLATFTDAFLTSAQGTEVLGGYRHHVIEQLHDYAARTHTVDTDIEKYFWSGHAHTLLMIRK
jgi:hypothetical protein